MTLNKHFRFLVIELGLHGVACVGHQIYEENFVFHEKLLSVLKLH